MQTESEKQISELVYLNSSMAMEILQLRATIIDLQKKELTAKLITLKNNLELEQAKVRLI